MAGRPHCLVISN